LSVVAAPTYQEEVVSRLDEAREQLLALRRQQEELERQKSDLEELRRKQDEYARGRMEMIEKLTRGLVLLEREQLQAQRRSELCSATAAAFRDYVERLHAIRDEEWTSANVGSELSQALGVVENARLEYNRACTKLDCFNPAADAPEPDQAPATAVDWPELLRYARLGAVASLPLIVAGTLWLIVFLVCKP
jgi:DNA repair exonuclease SbcCD ATPase subunit